MSDGEAGQKEDEKKRLFRKKGPPKRGTKKEDPKKAYGFNINNDIVSMTTATDPGTKAATTSHKPNTSYTDSVILDRPKKKKKKKLYFVEVKLQECLGNHKTLTLYNPHKIGEGAFGKAFSAEIRVKGMEQSEGKAAIKVCKDASNVNERDIHCKLNHVNVVALFYHGIVASKLYLVLELMDRKNLYDFLREVPPSKSLGIYVELFSYQLFRGLAYCHMNHIIHRDIKSENLLILRHQGVLKIADFGCGTVAVPPRKHGPYVGTREFRAPELLMGSENYSTKVDVWSAAIVMSELVLRHPPFTKTNDTSELIFKIMNYLGNPSQKDCEAMRVEDKYPKTEKKTTLNHIFLAAPVTDFKHLFPLLREIFVYNPSKRLSAWDAAAHFYFHKLMLPDATLDNRQPLPDNLFDFTAEERDNMTFLARKYLLNREIDT